MLRNYLVIASDENGENLDLVVTAETAQQAIDLWHDYWDMEADGELRVKPLPAIAAQPMAHEWQDDEDDGDGVR